MAEVASSTPPGPSSRTTVHRPAAAMTDFYPSTSPTDTTSAAATMMSTQHDAPFIDPLDLPTRPPGRHSRLMQVLLARPSPALLRWLLVLLATFLAVHLVRILSLGPPAPWWTLDDDTRIRPRTAASDPQAWIRAHSDPHAKPPGWWARRRRPRAALISLVRNEELSGMLQSMRQLEFQWNRRYRYPWIFFNEVEFSDEFKAATSAATDAETQYHVVPREHWATPDWVNLTTYYDSLDYLGGIGVGKASMLSYRAMCRWQSGFFYRHPALRLFDYYWRVEPDVHFPCTIPYDPFAFLRAHGLVYGFNMAILDDARSFATLWHETRAFVAAHPRLLHPRADPAWLLDPATGAYANCQFFSNFEIASLAFFRGDAHGRYFDHLDRGGGFWYARYGDAPVHTLSVALFAARDRVWFFRDVGYQHGEARHCPPASVAGEGMCACEETPLDANFYRLVPMESAQGKPADTCVRAWLGGEWLAKREGWDADAERALGGDGYGGYVLEGMD